MKQVAHPKPRSYRVLFSTSTTISACFTFLPTFSGLPIYFNQVSSKAPLQTKFPPYPALVILHWLMAKYMPSPNSAPKTFLKPPDWMYGSGLLMAPTPRNSRLISNARNAAWKTMLLESGLESIATMISVARLITFRNGSHLRSIQQPKDTVSRFIRVGRQVFLKNPVTGWAMTRITESERTLECT